MKVEQVNGIAGRMRVSEVPERRRRENRGEASSGSGGHPDFVRRGLEIEREFDGGWA